MPKPDTFPTLLDKVHTIDIQNLKKWGYLKPNQKKGATLNWTKNGFDTGNISIIVNTIGEPYLLLSYYYSEQLVKYKVKLVTIPSNLGRGEVWYFRCHLTQNRCRKLYLINGIFSHREAGYNCMYDCQTASKKTRSTFKLVKESFMLKSYYDELYQKHFKKHYAGKPTKRYLKLMRKIQKAESIPTGAVERALMLS